MPRRELQANGHGHGHAAATGGVPPTAGAATQAAQRILTLSTESLDMMRGVTAVVKESLDRADAWVERLRVIGLQRQQQHPEAPEQSSFRGLPGSSATTPGLSELHFSDYGFPSPPLTGPGSPQNGFSTPAFDAPSPGVSYEFGSLTLDGAEGGASTHVTPKTVLKSLPEEASQDERPRAVEQDIGGNDKSQTSDSTNPGPHMSKDDDAVHIEPGPGPGLSKMDVDT